MGILYLVPTPIGNLEDITLRALRVLREVKLIAAEDTRTSRVLLQHFEITTPLTSYHEHNKLAKLDAIFAALESGDVALVSDAGTPGISDPGYELIREAIARGVTVTPLPGANAALTALIGSGLNTETFLFAGFPPRKPKQRRELFERLAHVPRTLIFYESPNRLTDMLADIDAVLADRPVVVARELTKIYEEFRRGTAAELLAHFTATPPRGEIVVLIDGAPPETPVIWGEDAVNDALRERLEAGESLRDAAKAIASESGWDRKAVYETGLKLKRS
ncbi:MAG: uroporphyrin-III C/tetrapyrrole methyltransferase [Chloroflexi bacterium OLB15]|nr:MAG: uroporphyrin-III C/tetrapyrrole methyltransferase [Chloroflexi bacterium OLB15]